MPGRRCAPEKCHGDILAEAVADLGLDRQDAPRWWTHYTEVFQYGIVFQEVFAGWAPVSAEAREVGWTVKDPLELYDDPDRKLVLHPEKDLSDPALRTRLCEEAAAEPSAAAAATAKRRMLGWCAAPCRSGAGTSFFRPG